MPSILRPGHWSRGIRWLGLQHSLGERGSGGFPLRLVRQPIDSGKLVLLEQAPGFSLPAYVVYPTDAEPVCPHR
ncbi:MAG: hypothetical protein WAL92_03765 [Thiogranum sp.]